MLTPYPYPIWRVMSFRLYLFSFLHCPGFIQVLCPVCCSLEIRTLIRRYRPKSMCDPIPNPGIAKPSGVKVSKWHPCRVCRWEVLNVSSQTPTGPDHNVMCDHRDVQIPEPSTGQGYRSDSWQDHPRETPPDRIPSRYGPGPPIGPIVNLRPTYIGTKVSNMWDIGTSQSSCMVPKGLRRDLTSGLGIDSGRLGVDSTGSSWRLSTSLTFEFHREGSST